MANLLLTRTAGELLALEGATWTGWSTLGPAEEEAAAAAAAAAFSELIAEARIPNWPVRVTTTKRGFEERTLAAAAELACVEAADSAPAATSGTGLAVGLAKRDLFGKRRERCEPAPSWPEDSRAAVGGAEEADTLAARAGCKVCSCDRKRLEAIRERANERAIEELAARSTLDAAAAAAAAAAEASAELDWPICWAPVERNRSSEALAAVCWRAIA